MSTLWEYCNEPKGAVKNVVEMSQKKKKVIIPTKVFSTVKSNFGKKREKPNDNTQICFSLFFLIQKKKGNKVLTELKKRMDLHPQNSVDQHPIKYIENGNGSASTKFGGSASCKSKNKE